MQIFYTLYQEDAIKTALQTARQEGYKEGGLETILDSLVTAGTLTEDQVESILNSMN